MLLNLATTFAVVSVASAAVITVTVGDGGFVFKPASVTAQNGDIVNFQFTGSPGNHTVSQAAFDKPCEQLSGGFDSGNFPVAPNFKGTPSQWNLTISDASKPIWYYCKQTQPAPHCLAGMVGAINPPSSGNTIEQFTNAAKALSSFPAQSAGSPTSGVGATPVAAASPSGTAPASGTAPPAASSSAPNSAVSVASSGVWALLATVLGIAIV